MKTPDRMLKIQTLGRFSITYDEKPVAIEWPDDTVKELFCSLLSPLDLYFTWDRISRSMWGEAETRTNRRKLKEIFTRHLSRFLIRELGFNPIIVWHDGLKIDRVGIHIDAFEFYSTIIEGLRLLSMCNNDAAQEKFCRANSLYLGSYLPEIPGKITENTRNEFTSLYRNLLTYGMRQTHSELCPGKSIQTNIVHDRV